MTEHDELPTRGRATQLTTVDMRKIVDVARHVRLFHDHEVPTWTVATDYFEALLDALDRTHPEFAFDPPDGHYLAWALDPDAEPEACPR